MEELNQVFDQLRNDLPSSFLGFVVSFLVLSFFISWEIFLKPRRVTWKKRKRSYRNNFLILIFNNFFLFLISGTSLYWVAVNSSSGLLNELKNPAMKFVVSLLLFDGIVYLWHILNHKIPFLWRFHSCHHSDQDLNSTTGFRFHLGELFLSIFYKSIFIFLLGFEASFVVLYEAAIFCFAVFHHSDLKIPAESKLKYFIVVPSHHTTHHSLTRENHDSNYAVIFSFWDRLFKTYNSYQPKEFGLINEDEKRFSSFLTFPFKRKTNLIFIALFFLLLSLMHQFIVK